MISTSNYKIIKTFIESVFYLVSIIVNINKLFFFTLIIDIGSYLIRLFVLLFIININIVCMKLDNLFFYHYVLLVDSALQLLDYLNKILHLYQDFLLFKCWRDFFYHLRFMDQFYYAILFILYFNKKNLDNYLLLIFQKKESVLLHSFIIVWIIKKKFFLTICWSF
jgi:hypothetical protein